MVTRGTLGIAVLREKTALPGAVHAAPLVMCRRSVCGFYIKTRSRPRIPFLGVHLKTIIMNMCYNTQVCELLLKIARTC